MAEPLTMIALGAVLAGLTLQTHHERREKKQQQQRQQRPPPRPTQPIKPTRPRPVPTRKTTLPPRPTRYYHPAMLPTYYSTYGRPYFTAHKQKQLPSRPAYFQPHKNKQPPSHPPYSPPHNKQATSHPANSPDRTTPEYWATQDIWPQLHIHQPGAPACNEYCLWAASHRDQRLRDYAECRALGISPPPIKASDDDWRVSEPGAEVEEQRWFYEPPRLEQQWPEAQWAGEGSVQGEERRVRRGPGEGQMQNLARRYSYARTRG